MSQWGMNETTRGMIYCIFKPLQKSPVRECGSQIGLTFTSLGSTVLVTAVYGPSQGRVYGFNISIQILQGTVHLLCNCN